MTPLTDEDNGAIPSRRVVLRGALAAGGSLCLPLALWGCNAKKEAGTGTDTGSTAPAAPPASPPTTSAESSAAPPAATAKLPPASVQYQATPKGDQKCSGCMHFIAESGTCKLVDGPISPEGWCTLWLKKA